jgi:hypothetical protein
MFRRPVVLVLGNKVGPCGDVEVRLAQTAIATVAREGQSAYILIIHTLVEDLNDGDCLKLQRNIVTAPRQTLLELCKGRLSRQSGFV